MVFFFLDLFRFHNDLRPNEGNNEDVGLLGIRRICFFGKKFWREIMRGLRGTGSKVQDPVVRKPINANPGLKLNQGSYFSVPKR